VAVSGDYAYVAYNSGVAVINISYPSKPQEITTLKTDETASGILIYNDDLFIGSAGNKNLYIYDNSNPDNPTLVSSTTLSGAIYGISKNEDYLYAATKNGYLEILDVSDLSNIIKVKSLNCQGQGMDLIYNGGYVYYANSRKGLQIIDVNDPSNPEILRTLNGTSGAWDIFISGDNMFLAKHMYGFDIFSLENPELPTRIVARSNGGESYGIWADESYLYISDLHPTIKIGLVFFLGNRYSC
jgi:hypothetical protein